MILDILVPFGPILRRAEKSNYDGVWLNVLLRAITLTFFVYWLFSFIPIVGGVVYGLVIVPLVAQQHMKDLKITSSMKKALVLVWYLTVVVIGFGGIWGFVGHTFLADMVAADIGWAIGSPFQTELAFYHLGLGVAALYSIKNRQIIPAIVIAKSIFWLGAAGVHIYDAVTVKNFSSSNIGGPLIADLVYPVIFLSLLSRSANKIE